MPRVDLEYGEELWDESDLHDILVEGERTQVMH